jgi:hypothetical protein
MPRRLLSALRPLHRATLPALLLALAVPAAAQAPAASRLRANLVDNIERPLRYTPDGVDFVIRNGTERFNRPLYGGNTAFRVDGGDLPEFVLYLPGRGGNLRFALRDPADGRVRWLDEAAEIVARYRPGGLLHEIRDPALGPGVTLRLAAYALPDADGLVVRAEHDGAGELELLWAYGGVNGQRGRRDGDIGTENVPISRWFQLEPDFCTGNRIELRADGFDLTATLPREQRAVLRGTFSAPTAAQVADAAGWRDAGKLFGAPAEAGDRPVIAGRTRIAAATPTYLAVQRTDATATTAELDTYLAVTTARPGERRPEPVVAQRPALAAGDLPGAFAAAEAHFAALRRQVVVETPDSYINAAVAALNVGADAVWDEPQGAVMHGAIAWRSKLLGWRGPYAMDALGWHDRMRRHLTYWAGRQNTGPIPAAIPPPDVASNLARSEAALHSNGDISNSHYDMNLVYIDALLRHLLWTGDVAFAGEVWPVIERHLAWQRRLFRREYEVGGDKLPLYEAYAAIWASDDLQYHGGGTAHASAYNYWHNRMAARLARLLGRDGAPYDREADLVRQGMDRLLWTGTHYAEFRDWLGLRRRHDSAALWSFYHTADSAVLTGGKAAATVLSQLPRLPIRGPGVPADRDYAMLSTTNWMPYTWSLNNVVMGENIHTALGLWQEGRPDDAFTLLKASLLASMFMGICPGNVGSMNYLDAYRRESQRDFADGAGVTSRALVEGLFGLRPDALAGVLEVVPGWPADWPRASLRHPRVALGFAREDGTERYTVEPRFGRPMELLLRLPRRGETAQVRVDGAPATGEFTGDRLVLRLAASERARVVEVAWQGAAPAVALPSVPPPAAPDLTAGWGAPVRAGAALDPVALGTHFNDRVTAIFRPGKYLSPRSPFVSLAMPSQGIGAWAGHVNAKAEIDDSGLRAAAAQDGLVRVPTGLAFATPGPGDAPNIVFVSQWDNYPREATVPLAGRARRLHLLMAGSTNAMQSRFDNGEVEVVYADGSTARLPLRNPETWWPIEQDYFLDDFQFRTEGPLPIRVDLKTGKARVLTRPDFLGRGRTVPGGAATVLELALDPAKPLRALTVRALANEVVIGLMAATLERDGPAAP